jgi:hypothetical protein
MSVVNACKHPRKYKTWLFVNEFIYVSIYLYFSVIYFCHGTLPKLCTRKSELIEGPVMGLIVGHLNIRSCGRIDFCLGP